MLHRLRALLNHPAVETALITANVGLVMSLLTDVLKKRQRRLDWLDKEIRRREDILARTATEAAATPGPVDLDPLGRGEDPAPDLARRGEDLLNSGALD